LYGHKNSFTIQDKNKMETVKEETKMPNAADLQEREKKTQANLTTISNG